MTASVLRVVALLACVAATSVAQQPLATETLDEVTVARPAERVRERGPGLDIPATVTMQVSMGRTVGVRLGFRQDQTQVVFRRKSAARLLSNVTGELNLVNPPTMELLPDRLIAAKKPWIRRVGYLLAAGVDEADGVPAHIPFGAGVALVNLDYLSLRGSQEKTIVHLANAMHPQTRKCELAFSIYDFWPEGADQYVLLGNTRASCNRVAQRREGDLVFADSVPAGLRQVLQELYDPIASRLANLLGSEPGNIFIAWWPESPHDGYRLQLSWNRNSLLLFNGAGWEQGVDAAQRESLRSSFMSEQVQRRIRESDRPGAFTQSAAAYLLLLTHSAEERTTPQILSRELPTWITGCNSWMQQSKDAGKREQDSYSLECGLLLQFVYDAVIRYRSAGNRNAYDLWRNLLDESFRRKQLGVRPEDFIASSSEAQRIAQGLLYGDMDWPAFVAALDAVGVKLGVVAGEAPPAFEVRALEVFRN